MNPIRWYRETFMSNTRKRIAITIGIIVVISFSILLGRNIQKAIDAPIINNLKKSNTEIVSQIDNDIKEILKKYADQGNKETQ